MPPSIHPVDLIEALRRKNLTPAIVFLTSRRACDDAMQAFERSQATLPPNRQQVIAAVLEQLGQQYPSIAEHPLAPMVQRVGVAAHHAGHLPSWKIAIEELMWRGCLDAVFATTTLAAGVDFPARTVVITQSSVRKTRDFTDLTISEIQQLAGRAGRRGKDLVGFAVVTPSPYIDLNVITKGLTGQPEPIESQFVIAYPMVLNLLKAHPLDQIQAILARSFAQFQLNQRAESLERKLDVLHVQMEPYGPRVCTDWVTQWQVFDHARRQKAHRIHF
jgi:superfamily II RNA helicase